MICPRCNVRMVFTGIICLCGHKQYVCQKCRRLWSFNHKELPIDQCWEIDIEGENKIKAMNKGCIGTIKAQSYDVYIDSIIENDKSKGNKGF